jgi:hypothetical protein
MTTLQEAVALAEADKGLAVVSTLRADATIQSTIVNAGIIDHPESGETVLAFVSAGKVRQANLRARPQISATFRSGWRYATVEGRADIAGPDDPQPWLRPEALRLLLRDIFTIEMIRLHPVEPPKLPLTPAQMRKQLTEHALSQATQDGSSGAS